MQVGLLVLASFAMVVLDIDGCSSSNDETARHEILMELSSHRRTCRSLRLAFLPLPGRQLS
jgi:hypothetical protein